MAKGYISPYRTYTFSHGRDPVMDRLHKVVQASGKSLKDIHIGTAQQNGKGGVSVSTMHNWWKKKKTCRPQFCTVAATAKYLGVSLDKLM